MLQRYADRGKDERVLCHFPDLASSVVRLLVVRIKRGAAFVQGTNEKM